MKALKKRACPRNYNESMILLQTKDDYSGYLQDSCYYTYAKMYNSSKDGIYLEADFALQPGSDICIKIVNSTPDDIYSPEAYKAYKGKVKWCQETQDSESSAYGIGVQYCKTPVI